MTARWLAALALAAIACEGPVGPPGDPGDPGPPGPPGDPLPYPDGGPIPDPIPLEPEGLVGRVLDLAGEVVAGRVVLLPASDVEALAAQAIDPTLPPAQAAAASGDEPIEDLLDARADLPSAPIDAQGVYRFTSLPDAPVFVVVVPDGQAQLPGGELARAARERASLVGQRVDLHVSAQPSARARNVGSSACVRCHGRHDAFGTAHFASLRVPRRLGYLQETSRFANPDGAYVLFEAGTTLYFYDCDAGATEDACRIAQSPPAGPAVVSFTIELERDLAVPLGEPGAYVATIRNQRGIGSARYPIELGYGGLIYGQQFLTSVARPGGRERHALPFLFAGRASPADPRWRDAGSGDFYDHAAGTLRAPSSDCSFDRRCASCHGMGVRGDAASGFHAYGVPSFEGAFDYDGDGRLEELDAGCEGCHGPGSEHVDASGRGVAIVSPRLLTASRADAICGRCHTPEAPAAAVRPGARRSELLAALSRPEIAPGDRFASGDPRHPRTQYADHVQTRMHRNGALLTSCNDCHEPHGRGVEHDLRVSTDDNSACTSCHSDLASPRAHVEAEAGNRHDGLEDVDLVCTACHMAPTAQGGMPLRGLLDEHPTGSTAVQYYVGDLGSHRQRVSRASEVGAQPTSYTQACGLCHAVSLPNP